MKKIIKLLFLISLVATSQTCWAQWSYIEAIDNSLDKNISVYETWLSSNGFINSKDPDPTSQLKSHTLSDIYGIHLTGYLFQANRQPMKVRVYADQKKYVRAIDIFMINPQSNEYENLQKVIVKSGYKLKSKSNNKTDGVAMAGFTKKNHRINLTYANDKTYLILSGTSLGTP